MPVRPERDLPPTAPEAAGTGNGALGKPSETAGRKVIGTKAVGNVVELNQWYQRD